MAPVQTFSSSPITAAKAPTATATTQSPTANKTAPATTTAAATSAYVPPASSAQPGSRPFVPAATSSASSAPGYYAQPTPTQPLPFNNNPPAPQPGAVPTPPGASSTSSLPPPPKNGETLGPEHTGQVPPMPPQMSYPAPQASHAIRGTSTANHAAAAYPSPYEAGPVPLPVGTALGGGINLATDMSHPPGYQQDAHAAEFSGGQRVAHDFSSGGGVGGRGGGFEEDGSASNIWNTAKKWASAAGDTLAAAEGEVWKAVNKDQK